MKINSRPLSLFAACALLASSFVVPARAQVAAPRAQSSAAAQATTPQTAIDRIKNEGMNRSQVTSILDYLTNGIGPRLTNSPNMRRANEWTRDKLTDFGLTGARLEAWGPFGRGWSLRRFTAQVTAPQTFPVIAYPRAWSPGTNGALTANVVYVDAKTEADLEKYKGKLKGAIVLTGEVRDTKPLFEPPATRFTEKELLAMANAPTPTESRQFFGIPDAKTLASLPPAYRERIERYLASAKLGAAKRKLFDDEGAALIVEPSRAGSGGTLFVESASVAQPFDTPSAKRLSAWSKDVPKVVPQIVVTTEDFNRIARMAGFGQNVQMTVDLGVEFHDEDLMGYNTIAEIPGTDLKDEIVMLGAHLDSWHSATGATDNAAGSAVVMEAARILKSLNLQPRRTIRVALWSGEEQGLYGSRAYVAQHFGTIGNGSPSTAMVAMAGTQKPAIVKKPDYDKFSAYFNVDNGTGKIRGVYMQGNELVRPIFREWLAPFTDVGASVLTSSNTGGTDHLPFDAIGLPGFQFIQDEIEYESRTHHSNQDVYERLQADDMKQAATVLAAFVYNAAMMNEKLPRKPVRTE